MNRLTKFLSDLWHRHIKPVVCDKDAVSVPLPNLIAEEINHKVRVQYLKNSMENWKPDYKIEQNPDGTYTLFKRGWKVENYWFQAPGDPYVSFHWHRLKGDFTDIESAEMYMYIVIEPERYYYDTEGRIADISSEEEGETPPPVPRPH